MNYKTVKFSGHALQQMFLREIGKDEVIAVLETGEILREYPEDKPYPSLLKLGFPGGRPVHIVFAVEEKTATAIVITAYLPPEELWYDHFRKRRGEP
jgi:hypothetical protein